MTRFEIQELPLAGLKLIKRQQLGDARGHFSRLFCSQELAQAGWTVPIAQINHSVTARCGTVRGMHFQKPPHTEIKLVTCLRGSVWDVAVDVRAGSATFLHWHAQCLTAENLYSMLIPEGFAHGFQTLSDDCELIYLHSKPYVTEAESALNAFDGLLCIDWPLSVTVRSERDTAHPWLDDGFKGVIL
ncbi:MAG: dTDP-4-dehydrorhamnose 3,5-epimerase family protein [Rhodoferax sp.]|nr:dTDP-4-dehydrorhamnose 3,5-epimerase family protein [Rhodoferax sp.]